jgi:crotonobetainyl-CoA:carnitine CoA-transferase CaiB-like acyl-CoA transferase
MLSPYRVLDLTTARGMFCGQILGDLGADVIMIEPPGGSPTRRFGPFYRDVPHPDRSLFWWSLNRNKRSITLDITSSDGQAILRRLMAGTHFIINNPPKG